MFKKYLILVLILVVTFLGFFANAQVRNTDIILNTTPEFPNPNQNVTATLSSHSINLDKANISWSVNDEQLSSGIGKKTFSFNIGAIGTTTTLTASIDTIDGQNLSKTLTLTSANVDMLWEAYDAYTPPFYRGKALAPSQGKFKVVAIPNIINGNGKVNINNLSYSWTKDGNPQMESSGWGKNYFIFQNSFLDKGNTASVKVSDISGNTTTSGKISLYTVDPKIIFYKKDVLGLDMTNALSDGFQVNKSGESFVVAPYFFSPKDLSSSDLTFDWYVNGSKIETPEPKNIISIKPDEGKTGSASIKVEINNVNTLFQSMIKQLNVQI